MSRTLTVGRLLPLAFALIVAAWALAPTPAVAGVVQTTPAVAGVAPTPAPQPALTAAKAAPGCGTAAVAGPLANVLNPAPASSVPPFMDPTGAKKGYCHCGCGPATCHTSADCGGASCDPFPSCC